LFSVSFFIQLGVVVLVIAVGVVYVESQIRQQNQKLEAMLGVVSALATDNHSLRSIHMIPPPSMEMDMEEPRNHVMVERAPMLIEVSDDDMSEDEIEDEDMCDVKVVTLSISDDEVSDEDEADALGHYNVEDLMSSFDDDVEPEESDEEDALSQGYVEELLGLKYEDEEEDASLSPQETKKIVVLTADIPLEHEANDKDEELKDEEFKDEEVKGEEVKDESKDEEVKDEEVKDEEVKDESKDEEVKDESKDEEVKDEVKASSNVDEWKKLPLPKLRTMAVEKGVASQADAHKLKKHELLKLMGVE